jgi:hypothetical protein
MMAIKSGRQLSPADAPCSADQSGITAGLWRKLDRRRLAAIFGERTSRAPVVERGDLKLGGNGLSVLLGSS